MDPGMTVARIISFFGLLDLDHIRAEVGQHHGRRRPRQQSRQIENGHSIEGFCHRDLSEPQAQARANSVALGSSETCGLLSGLNEKPQVSDEPSATGVQNAFAGN